jgi:hypothetical protein
VSLPAARAELPVPSLRLPPLPVAVVSLLMVASTVVWRRGDIFSGSLDVVVVGKAALSVLALVLAFLSVLSGAGDRRRLGTGSLWFLAVLLAASVFGALTHGTLMAGAVVAVRVVIVALTVFLLLRAAAPHQVIAGVVWASGTVALVAAGTNPGSAGSGRLEGGLPPLNPNELALLSAIVVLAVLWRVVLGEVRWYLWGTAAVFLGIIWLTGSRTALLMLVAGVVVMAVQIRRAPPGLVVGALCLAAAGVMAVAFTGALTGFLERDGTGTSTLDSRFIAWSAARYWAESPWQMLFGGGLSVKLIPVEGQWWDTQLLDSSWVSALVQAGVVGLVVAAVWSLWVLRGARRMPRPYRILFLGVLVFLLGRSTLESGLFDATPGFLVFMTASLLCEGGSRPAHRTASRATADASCAPSAEREAWVSRPAAELKN